jgi:hypothetical protein
MALEIADVEALWLFSTKINRNEANDTPDWKAASSALRAMIDDQAQLKAAMDAISAVEGEANSKALADAAIALSEAALT